MPTIMIATLVVIIAVMLVFVLPLAVVVAVVFVVPVALVVLPALRVPVVVRMAPIRSRIRRPLPVPRHPNVVVALRPPVTFHPCIARIRRRWRRFIHDRRRRRPDEYRDLRAAREARHCKSAQQ